MFDNYVGWGFALGSLPILLYLISVVIRNTRLSTRMSELDISMAANEGDSSVASLYRNWHNQLEISRVRSWSIKMSIYIAPAMILFLTGRDIIFLPWADMQLPMTLYILVLDSFPIFIISTLWFLTYRFVTHRSNPSKIGSSVDLAPEAAKIELQKILTPLAKRMNIDLTKIHCLISVRNFGAAPSMFEVKGSIFLAIPLGFFKVLSESPDAARAMLSHEFAHFLQRDSWLWLLATGYADSVRKLIGLQIAVSLVFTLISFSIAFQGQPGTAMVNLLIQCLNIVLSLSITLGFLRIVRSGRIQAELSADLAAVLFSSMDGLRAGLEEYCQIHESDVRTDSMHPTPTSRLARLENYFVPKG